jgi:Calcineurin-like phosphoesterase
MNITRKWKRALFLGCSHGVHADPTAIQAILKFRESYKPQTVVHLGDFCDTTAFRSGAATSPDGGCPVQPDIDAGFEFLDQIRPTHILCGNHEDRLWRLRESNVAVISYAAGEVVNAIEAKAKRLKAILKPYSGIWQGVEFGGYKAMHGVMFGESATRDHAEAFGNCIHAHTHRAAQATGRRYDQPIAFGVGTLTQSDNLDYAKARRSTLSWSQGFVWGEYCEDAAQFYLYQKQKNTPWMLPA